MDDLTITNDYEALRLVLPPNMEYAEWEHRGKMLKFLEDASSWWMGDWLDYGERTYGERYAQGASGIGVSPERLRKCQWVAEKIPFERRREHPLTFSHHEAVAALPPAEQDRLLDMAKEKEWSTRELWDQRRKEKGEDKDDRPDKRPPECPSCGFGLEDYIRNLK